MYKTGTNEPLLLILNIIYLQVLLGVLEKDETKTADMMDILISYHQYVPTKSRGGQPIQLPIFCDRLSVERVIRVLAVSSRCGRRRVGLQNCKE
jgi:hypothetical protein